MKNSAALFVIFYCFGVGEATFAISSFTITDEYSITTTEATKLTYSIAFSNGDSEVSVETVNLYLSDEDGSTKSEAFPSEGEFPLLVPATGNEENPFEGLTADVIADIAQCSSYSHICAEAVTLTSNSAEPPPADCVEIETSNSIDCSHISITSDSFKITAPSDYTITTTTEVELTYEIKLKNSDGDLAIDVTAINLYLADDDDMSTKSTHFASVGSFPITVAASDEKHETSLLATVIADAAQCASYKKLCAEAIPNNDTECIDANVDCSDAPDIPDLASGLLTITSPDDAISCTDKPTVKFDLHVCDVGGEGGTITDVKFYYMDTDTYDATSSKLSPEHSTKLTAEVDADGDHTFSDQEVELTDDDKCEDYSYLCALIVVTDDTDSDNNYSCIKLDLSEISTDNCKDSAATGIGVGKYSILASVIFALASYLF